MITQQSHPKTYLAAFGTLGLLFGFALSRMGASEYDYIAKMFLLEDFHIFGVIGSAVVVAGIVFFVIEKLWPESAMGLMIRSQRWPVKKETIVGGLLFGAGWGLAGLCPGTVLAMVGEGKTTAIVGFAGILAGTYLFGVFEHAKIMRASASGPNVSQSRDASHSDRAEAPV